MGTHLHQAVEPSTTPPRDIGRAHRHRACWLLRRRDCHSVRAEPTSADGATTHNQQIARLVLRVAACLGRVVGGPCGSQPVLSRHLARGLVARHTRPGHRTYMARAILRAPAPRVVDAGTHRTGHGRRRRSGGDGLHPGRLTAPHARRVGVDCLHQGCAAPPGIRAVAVEGLNLRNMLRSAKGTQQQPGTNVRTKSGLNRSMSPRRAVRAAHIHRASVPVAWRGVPPRPRCGHLADLSLVLGSWNPRDPGGLLLPGVRLDVQR